MTHVSKARNPTLPTIPETEPLNPILSQVVMLSTEDSARPPIRRNADIRQPSKRAVDVTRIFMAAETLINMKGQHENSK